MRIVITMSEKVTVTGVFVDPTVTVQARPPNTMTIETAVGKLLVDTTKKAQAAYQLESLSIDDMTAKYYPGSCTPPSLRIVFVITDGSRDTPDGTTLNSRQ